MLKQHNQLFVSLLVLADACAVSLAWVGSYLLRFAYLPVDPDKGVPSLTGQFLPMLPLVVAAHLFIFYRIGLYRARRTGRLGRELRDIGRAFLVAVVAAILIDYAMPATNKISRQFMLTYALLGATFFGLFRATVRMILRALRRRGWNRRTVVVVGTGRAAQQFVHALRANAWTGMEVLYFVDDRPEESRPHKLLGLPVHGPFARLPDLLDDQPPDGVVLALPNEQADRTNEVLKLLDLSFADVRLVPEIDPAYSIHANVSVLDGVPVLSLRQTPLQGYNAILKRSFDIIIGGLCLLIALPALALIALLIKLSSPGPVLYKQRRTGLDGRQFDIYKFRTMRIDAEARGPVWSQTDDPRRTRIGRFLRRTSLDELPNLLNVIRGEMSLVGPRPERPEFIARFRHEIPRYMLRHKMKAGMTGFAQVNGYRGDTSLRKRIQHDLHYIRNWSLKLDLQILARTLTGVWFSRHET